MTIHLTATAATRVVRKRREVNRLRQRRWRRPTVRSSLLLMLPALLFLGVFSAYPLEELVRMSLSRVTPGNMLDVSWPFSGGENYRATLNDQGFPVVIRNTLILIVVSVGVTLALGVLAALILQRESRFSNGVHGIMIFMWALPPVVTGSVWKFLLSSSGPIPEVLNSLRNQTVFSSRPQPSDLVGNRSCLLGFSSVRVPGYACGSSPDGPTPD